MCRISGPWATQDIIPKHWLSSQISYRISTRKSDGARPDTISDIWSVGGYLQIRPNILSIPVYRYLRKRLWTYRKPCSCPVSPTWLVQPQHTEQATTSLIMQECIYTNMATYRAFHKFPQICTANHATFPIQMNAIIVYICSNFWGTQYMVPWCVLHIHDFQYRNNLANSNFLYDFFSIWKIFHDDF